MTQSTIDKTTYPDGDAMAVSKLGETGETVVYIFPGGNAQVEKGKKATKKSGKTFKAEPENVVNSVKTKQSSKSNLNTNSVPYPKPPKPPKSPALPPKVIGDRLVKSGLISSVQLQVALYDQSTMNLDLAQVLIARGWVDETTLISFLTA